MTRSMYGYARLPGVEDGQLLTVRRKLSDFAREHEFRLAEYFVVQRPGEALGAWRELVARAHVGGVRNIVVPSLTHLHPVRGMARLMQDILADSIGGRVWVVDEDESGADEADADPPEDPGVMRR